MKSKHVSIILLLSVIFISFYPSYSQTIEEDKISKKSFYSIDQALIKANKVKSLVLIDTSLNYLPPEIEKFKNLELLNISTTKIKKFPNEISRLGKIKYIYLSNNFELDVENSLKLISKEKVQKISLTNQYITNIPSNLNEFSFLKELYLYSNKISILTSEIADLKELEVLLLDNNNLITLPDNLKQLESLRTLTLTGNLFKEFPKVLCDLKSLENLYIGNEELIYEELLQSMQDCKSLRYINLSNISFKQKISLYELNKLPNIETVVLSNILFEFRDLPLNEFPYLSFKLVIISNKKFTENELNILKKFNNVTIQSDYI